jgi:Peptidase propeptide and YPEB domain
MDGYQRESRLRFFHARLAPKAQLDRSLPKQTALSQRKAQSRRSSKREVPQVIKLSLFAGLILLTAAVPLKAYTGQQLAKDAKISIKQARAIALKAHPGEITDEELEKERGGSGLRYSFDIKRRGTTQEVGVDARTGRVLENKKEGPHPD